jgi:hypothetical protein
MRIWLNPARLDSYGLAVPDVSQAISSQNVQVSSGEVGAVPSTKGQRLDATIIGPTRFTTPEQFEEILLKVNPDGSQVRLKDVATVELGSQYYQPRGRFNGNDSAGIGINLAPGANQLQVAQALTGPQTTSHVRKGLSGKPWRHRPAARLLITSKAICCAGGANARQPFPNTRRRSQLIAMRWAQDSVSAVASS